MVAAGERLADLIADAVSLGVLVTTPDNTVVWTNQAFRALVDADGGVAQGTRIGDLATLGLLVQAGMPGSGRREAAWRAPDGRRRWLDLECRGLTVPGADGGLLVYEVSDVTGRHEHEQDVLRRERRASRVEALAKVGSWEWDLPSDEVTWSDELLVMFGLEPGTKLDYLGYRTLLHPDDVGLIERTLAEALETCKPFTYTHRMYLADRITERTFECFGEVVTDAEGRPLRVLGTAHDITEKRRVTDELAYLAEHDPLTGLPNRRGIVAHLRRRLDRGDGRTGALLLIDVDDFADVNHMRGHVIGDQVMRAVAQLLHELTGRRALLGRLGGDLFAAVLPDGDAGEAMAMADALCDAIAQRPVLADGTALRMTVSIGVAPLDQAEDVDILLAHADVALYEAKSAGRNRARLFPTQQDGGPQRIPVLQRVRDALDTGLMILDAQPIVDLATRRVDSHELLIRLRDGLGPPLGPADFLPAVERTDLVLFLDRWVVQQAVTALAAHRGLRLEVNVSSRSVEDPSFGDEVLRRLRDADVNPERFGLEISETAAMMSMDAAARLAERLTGSGCRFTLDDFGSGFGSFVYLKNLPFTAVKIAGDFVAQADSSVTDPVLVDAVARIARRLGMRTIAEGVDREPLAKALQRLGVDRGQGLQLGRPGPLPQLLEE